MPSFSLREKNQETVIQFIRNTFFFKSVTDYGRNAVISRPKLQRNYLSTLTLKACNIIYQTIGVPASGTLVGAAWLVG